MGLKFSAIFFAVATLFCSCGEKENETPAPEQEAPATMTVAPTSYEAPVEGGEFTVSVTAPARPTAVASQKWVTVTDGTYSKYKIDYPVKVASNETYEERAAVVTIKSGSFSQEVKTKFVNSLYNLGNAFKNIAVFILGASPYLVLIAVVAVVVILIVKAKKKKRNNR